MTKVDVKEAKDLETLGSKYFLYFKTNDCGVCGVMEEKLFDLFRDVELPMALVQVEEVPELRGKYLVFSGPTLLLIDGEKEIYRQSGFMDFERLSQVVRMWTQQ